jgi:hypothetical protein
MGQELIDISGERFGRLIVLKFDHFAYREYRGRMKSISMYLVRCDCGEEKIVRRSNLTTRTTNSCGCLHRELSAARCGLKSPAFRHGRTLRGFNSQDYEKWAWANRIRQRDKKAAA